MTLGTVKFFNATKGFGFISPDGGGTDLFVHASAAEAAGMPTLTEGQRLSFEIEADQKGSKAVRLGRVPVEGAAPPAADETPVMPMGAHMPPLTIYHNPDCRVSSTALDEIRRAGFEPRVVEYLKTPLTREEFKSLAGRMKLSARELVRKYEPLYEELGLENQSDEQLLDAMVANPVLINRPIVATETTARLCRPSTAVKAFLVEASQA